MSLEIRHTRARNLGLLIDVRFGSQRSFTKRFKPYVNPTEVSLMCGGEKPISDYRARSIEKELELPPGWFDQDNWQFLFLTPEKNRLVGKLAQLDLSHKNSRKVARIWNRRCAQTATGLRGRKNRAVK